MGSCREKEQLDLFGGALAVSTEATETKPANDVRRLPVVDRVSAPTWVKNGVVHVHLAGGLTHAEKLPTGALTRGECAEWIVPCRLYECRFRLDDLAEMRTRKLESEHSDDDEMGLDSFLGPRDARGAYYSETPMGAGTWCSLTVADEGGEGDGREIEMNISLEELGTMEGVTREMARRIADDAIDVIAINDAYDDGGGRILRSMYGDRGSVKKRSIEPEEEIDLPGMKDAVRAAKEPRSVPSIKRRPRKNVWAGVTRIVPEQFIGRVNVRLMDQMGTLSDRIPERLMKPLKPPMRRGSGT